MFEANNDLLNFIPKVGFKEVKNDSNKKYYTSKLRYQIKVDLKNKRIKLLDPFGIVIHDLASITLLELTNFEKYGSI